MFSYSSKRLITVLLVLLLLVSVGFRCKCVPEKVRKRIEPLSLSWWRVTESAESVSDIVNNFRQIYPHITINYQQFRPEEYEMALLEAWAEDRGPDIFSIPNTWIGKYQSKILYAEAGNKVTIGRQILAGTIKKEPKIIVEEKTIPNLRTLKENFVDVVVEDVYRDNKLWGLPLALDTLALYYNRDLLNQAKIITPPADWEEFVEDVRLLNIYDRQGNLIQSATSLGTSNNIEIAADILSLLMLQNGTLMITPAGNTGFNQPSQTDPNYFPGEEALRFYTDFANPAKEIYSWNKQMPESLDAFAQGKTAFFFGYSYHLPLIKSQAPNLNFDIAKVPQIAGSLKEVNYANYWVEAVSKKTRYPNEAWAFLLFATEAQNAKTYLERVKRPTAHRSLIKSQLEDFDLIHFAEQVLTSQSWYRGKDWTKAEKAIKNMIDDVVEGKRTIKEAINFYIQIVNQTY